MWPYIIFPVLYNRKSYFFRIGHSMCFFFVLYIYNVREVTRWFLSSASKLFLIVIYNQINLFNI